MSLKLQVSLMISVFGLVGCSQTTQDAPDSRIAPPTTRVLGPEWQCFSAPDGFLTLGRIFELRPSGQVVQRETLSTEGAEFDGPVGFGTINTRRDFTLGGTLQLLEKAIPNVSANLSGSFNRSRTTSLTLSNNYN